jgi:hypothetical protein
VDPENCYTQTYHSEYNSYDTHYFIIFPGIQGKTNRFHLLKFAAIYLFSVRIQ